MAGFVAELYVRYARVGEAVVHSRDIMLPSVQGPVCSGAVGFGGKLASVGLSRNLQIFDRQSCDAAALCLRCFV